MDAGIGAKATVLDCMGGDGEGNCASQVQSARPARRGSPQNYRLKSSSFSVLRWTEMAALLTS
jgi:hypothetical protein